MRLYLESAGDFSIKMHKGTTTKCSTISVADARNLWQSGQVTDTNIAFQRLVEHNFDLGAVRRYYADQHDRWVKRNAEAAQ